MGYIIGMKKGKRTKSRVNKQGLMNSASRAHTTKKGRGSFRRPSNGRMFSDDEVVTWDGVDYSIRDRD